MKKQLMQGSCIAAIVTTILFYCTSPQNPFTQASNSRFYLAFKDSKAQPDVDRALSDTVGSTVKIGVCPYLFSYIESVTVTLANFKKPGDSVFVIKNFASDLDTLWFNFLFSSAGKCTVSVKAEIQGNRQYFLDGVITVFGKPVFAAIHPTLDTATVDTIATFSVSSTGDAPFFYQWYHGTTLLSGKTDVALVMQHLAFADSGAYTCFVTDKWGDTVTAVPGKLVVISKVKANSKPVISVGGNLNVLSTEICSLTVSATDPDSGQTHVFSVVKAPPGYAFAGKQFTWAPPSGYLGVDTVKTDTTIFTVTDNGLPPLSDTLKVTIVVSAPKAKVNSKPVISVSGHSNIFSTEICSLTVSATDPDSGQTHVFSIVKAPAGYAFAGKQFTWAPPSGYLGIDTVKTDTAIFTVTDNGLPPLSDTLKVTIVVSVKILPPDSVKGIVAVSRINGDFVFKWNKAMNADQYLVYRSKDTTGFTLYSTIKDTTFSNTIKDTAFFYYVVAMNSKGSSTPSQRIHSTVVNTAPKWAHNAISISVNEGSPVSFNCSDSCKDTNGDAITFQLISGGPVKDSLVGTIWKYSASYTDSGLYSVKIKAWDGTDSSILTIMLYVVNVPRPPQPQAQSISTNRNTPLQITLNAIDPDGDAITSWTIDTQTTHGTTSMASSGQPNVTYTPTSNFIGTDYFTFKASVGSLTSTYSAKVAIRVDTNNIAPVISQKLAAKTLNKGDSLVLSVTINSDAFPAPKFYWYKNSAPAFDSTSISSWKKLALALSDSGYYYVIVKNVVGQDSSGAKVTMQCAPVISPKLAATTTVNSGSATPVSVMVNADATPVPTYQWYFNGQAISTNGTSASYSKTWGISDTGTYKVIASNAAGKDSSFTKLSVNLPPSAPVLVSPADGATNQLVSLSMKWNAVAIATSYYVQLASDTGFAAIIVSDSTLTDTVKATGMLANNTTYYWRVRAKNAVGASSWTVRRSFTTIVAAPSAPALVWPVNCPVVAVDTILIWTISNSATSYRVQVSINKNFTSLVDSASLLADTTRHVTGLPYGTKYYWRAGATNAGGTTWSVVDSFVTNLHWTAVSGETSVRNYAQSGGNLFAGGNGIFLSTDSGATWVRTDTCSAFTNNGVSALASNGSLLFAGVPSYGVFRSGDNGVSWTLGDTTGFTGSNVQALTVCNGYLFAGTNNGLFRSSNNGTSWSSVINGIGDLNIYSLISSGNYVYLGNGYNIYVMIYNGSTWSLPSSGPPGRVGCFAVNGNYLYASVGNNGTYGSVSGIFRSSDNAATWVKVGDYSSNLNSFAANGSYLFEGYSTLGVFFSANFGISWTVANYGILYSSRNYIQGATIIGKYVIVNNTTGGIFRSVLPQ
jgi:hypothetical protein